MAFRGKEMNFWVKDIKKVKNSRHWVAEKWTAQNVKKIQILRTVTQIVRYPLFLKLLTKIAMVYFPNLILNDKRYCFCLILEPFCQYPTFSILPKYVSYFFRKLKIERNILLFLPYQGLKGSSVNLAFYF